MTGPRHFQEAQNLLEAAVDCSEYDVSYGLIMQAQVHATLALAAATALYDADLEDGKDTEYQAWRKIAGSEVTS